MQKKKIDPKVLKTIVIFAAVETLIVALLVTADILTKHFAFQNVAAGEELKYLGGFLTVTAVKNTGASFGIFGSSTVALTIVSFLCSLLVYAFSIYTERTRTPLLRAALAFILAGAVGNLIDRAALGYVRDMIQLSIFPWVFNVADTYLTIGVILILIYVVFFYTRDKERADKRKAIAPANGTLTAEGLRVAEEDAEADETPTETEPAETSGKSNGGAGNPQKNNAKNRTEPTKPTKNSSESKPESTGNSSESKPEPTGNSSESKPEPTKNSSVPETEAKKNAFEPASESLNKNLSETDSEPAPKNGDGAIKA